MIINFLGDSITAGAGAETVPNMYTSIVGERLKATINNYGISGTRIARQTAQSINPIFDEDYLLRAEKMDKNADFVFVFGGTNDYGHGDAEMGSNSDKTPFSFYGAMNLLTDYLIKNYGKEKICFILPTYRFDEDNIFGDSGIKKKAGYPLSKYRAVIKEVCDSQGIDCMNICDIFPLPTSNSGDKFTMDGLHPNPHGHKLIADRLCDYINAKLSKNN